MIPLPSLSFTGGKGGDATGGTQGGSGFSQSFGGFSVGGKGNKVDGGNASTGTSTFPAWLWYVIGGGAALVVLFLILGTSRR